MTDLNVKYDIYQFNFKVLNKTVNQREKIGNIIFDGVLQIDDKNIVLSTYKIYVNENTSGDYSIECHFSNEYIIFSKKYNTDVSPLDLELLPEIFIVSTNNMKKDIFLNIAQQTDVNNFSIKMTLLKPLLYLSNNIGFNPSYKCALDHYIELLSSIGYEVIEPFRTNDAIADFTKPDWIWKVNTADILDSQVCDVIFTVYNGIAPDEGCVVESSYGFKTNAVVYYFRDDIRALTKYDVPMNIMLFASYNPNTWYEYYYTNVNDITNPNRLLVSDFYNYVFNKNKNKLPTKGFPYNNFDFYNN